MSKKHIAHVTPTYFGDDSVIGGGERYVHYLAKALDTTGGFDQCVFALGSEDLFFEHDGVLMRVLRSESGLPGTTGAVSSALWNELAGFDLAHVHQSLTQFGAYTIAIARSLGIPLVGTDHGGGENTLMLNGGGLELLDGMISVSRYAHDRIAGFYSGRHDILMGPVDTDRFTPNGVVRDLGMVLCVSRILPHKGIDRVIAALPQGLRLVVAGRVYHDQYYELLRTMANGKDVQFVHDADDDALLHLYRSAGLFVQASVWRDVYGNIVAKPELMGLTTLEALACGLPVAVSNAGSLPELVQDERFGRVFTSQEELSGILQEVSSHRWPTQHAEVLARAHVVEKYSLGVVGRRLADFYSDVMRG